MDRGLTELNIGIVASASVVGKTEHEGPLGNYFDMHDKSNRFGMKTWERSEAEMQRIAFSTVLSKCGKTVDDVDAVFAGDLLNQCIGSAYGLLDFNVPYFGLYGACSTAVEGLILSALLCSTGKYDLCGAVTSSHNCSAERQYRFPLEYGGQRPPTAQWTVTGAGAFLVSSDPADVCITAVMPGIVVEKGINDANNMGAAMAPAAANTLRRYFDSTGRMPCDSSMIVTGDLGLEGSAILKDLMKIDGYDISAIHRDCGVMIYDSKRQDTHAGGSGCGCSAVVLSAYFLPMLERGDIKEILFLGTGAMMSPLSIQQGKAIPGIAHLVRISSNKLTGKK